ncbi:hypothetical protein CH341_03195 [Rhodoplanes roseus]|uniref:AAA domain-containing protein n=1 Tax=Rhodoplanes roseus TaxID=29409 RepID=A0A327L5V5_9BRAD|nr:hypothetical protein CH341_03195 [Rhodoplanes roseus]
MLLDDERMPQLGSVDYLVEAAISGSSDDLLRDMVGVSSLTKGGGGRVDVVPALGRKSTLYPENVLPKLARAMIETITEESTISVGSQISSMIARLSAREAYDVILIDSRAGLAELAAPAMLRLGATVLLFGTAQKQTIEGYRSLLTALKLLAQRDRMEGRNADWRLMFKAVYAKASFNEDAAAAFRDDLYELFADGLYDEEQDGGNGDDDVTFPIDDQSAPHWPLVIPFNQSFIDFDPSRAPSHLTQAFYEQTFRPFLDGLDGIIASVHPEQP